jgi:hypothetical protein
VTTAPVRRPARASRTRRRGVADLLVSPPPRPVAPAPLPARRAARAPPATPASQNDPRSAAPYRAARMLWRAGLPAVFPPGTYWLARFANITVAAVA